MLPAPTMALSLVKLDHILMLPTDFERLYRESSAAVYRSAYRLLGNAHDAEDVLQTVFLRFLRRDASLAAVDNPETYLRHAAVNAALDILRARPRQGSALAELPTEPSAQPGQELSLRLRDALSRIDAKSAEIFLLRYIEGYGNKEIAQMLDMSATMVAVSLFRTRQKLQNEIRLAR